MEHLVAQQGENAMSDADAFYEMCRASRKVEGLKVGLRQVTKSIISKRAKLVIMSSAINEKKMKAVIEGLTAQYNNVPIYRVPSHEDLAEYVGITKKDETGKVKKRLRCSVAVVESFGEATQGQKLVLSRIGAQ